VRLMTKWRKWLETVRRLTSSRRERQLKVRESASLGERRLLAIVECGERQFLIGASGQNVQLLAELSSARDGSRCHQSLCDSGIERQG